MAKLGELAVIFSANTKKLDSALLSVQKKLKKTESGFLSLGKSLTRKLTLPLALAAAAAIKFAADFDKAMTESLAIMGDVSSGLRKEMAETAKVMSEDSVFAAKDLAAAYFFLASAGLSAENSIAALPVVTRFAQAGMFDLSIATDLLTDAQSALGLAVNDVIENQKNMIRVSDVLVGANTLANATVQQFSEALTNQAAAAFRTVNKEVEETVAVLAAFADQGRKGQVAGQQLAIVMTNLQTAWMENREEFEKLNIEVFDAQGNMKNMADIIGDLEKALKDLTPEQKIATLATLGFQDRARKTIQTLLGTSEKIRQYEEDLRSMGGITKEVSDNQMKSFSAQMSALGHTLQNLAIDIGNQFIPVIKVLGAIVKFIAKEFRKLPGIFKAVAAAVIVLGAAIGPVLIMYATWIKLSKSLIAVNIIAFLSKAKVAMLAFAAANAPLIAVIAGVLALGKVIDEGTKLFIKATDKAIAKEVELGNVLGATNALRKKLIKNEILTIQEWSEMIKRHGGDYKRVLIAIANHPAYKEIREKLSGVSKASKNWADILKRHNIPSIEEFNDEVSRLTRKKKILKEALDAGRIKLQTYRVEVEKVDKELMELTGRTKSYVAILRENDKKVSELKKRQKELNKALKDGKINLKQYREESRSTSEELRNLTGETKDLKTTLKELNEDLEDGVITWDEWADAAVEAEKRAKELSGGLEMLEFEVKLEDSIDDLQEFNDGWVQLGLTAPENIGKIGKSLEDQLRLGIISWEEFQLAMGNTIDIMETRWGDVISGMGNAFGDFFLGIMDKGSTFSENIKGLWEGIQNTFKGVVADMAQEYIENFLKKIVTRGITAFADVGKDIADLGKSVTSSITSIGSAASGIFVGIGAAVGTFLGGLIGKKTTGWQKAMQAIGIKTIEILQVILNHIKDTIIVALREIEKSGWLHSDILKGIEKTGWAISEKLSNLNKGNDRQVNILVDIRKLNEKAVDNLNSMVKLLKDTAGAATGFHGTVPTPTRMIVHPNEQIDITPFKDMGGRDAGTGGDVSISATFHISAIDENSVRNIVRDKIAPEFIEMVKGNVNEARTDLREAQGN